MSREEPDLEINRVDPPLEIKWEKLGCLVVLLLIVLLVTVPALPLLVLLFLITRLIQFIIKSESYERASKLKYVVEQWIVVGVVLLLLVLGVFAPFAMFLPILRKVHVLKLSLIDWIIIISMLSGIFLLYALCSKIMRQILIRKLSPPPGDVNSIYIVLEASTEVFGCILLCLGVYVVKERVVAFQHLDYLRLEIWIWIMIPIILLFGHNLIRLITTLLVLLLPKFLRNFAMCFNNKKVGDMIVEHGYLRYIANGIKGSTNFILTSIMLTLTWVFYFSSNHLENSRFAKSFIHFGAMTCVSVLFWSLLWFVKTGIMLHWEALSIYVKFKDNIIKTAEQLYFLVLLSHDTSSTGTWFLNRDKTYKDAEFSRKMIRKRLIFKQHDHYGKPVPSIYELQQAFLIYLAAKYALSEKKILATIDRLKDDPQLGRGPINTTEQVKEIISGEHEQFSEDMTTFIKLLNLNSNETITFEIIKKWMEKAHGTCLSLVNKLSSADDVAKCLRQITSSIIVVVVFFVWLLLTGLASVKVLVLLASPILAVSFIFADTAKTLFQGIIYNYVVNPYQIGDLCVVDGEMMEVRKITIWSTTFTRVRETGTEEEVIYSNDSLSRKKIVNHKLEFDWSDCIEYTRPTADKQTTQKMIKKIEEYLLKQENDQKLETASFFVLPIEAGTKLKIRVYFRHKASKSDGTYSECLKIKEKNRYDWIHDMKKCLNGNTPVSVKEIKEKKSEDHDNNTENYSEADKLGDETSEKTLETLGKKSEEE